MPVSNLIINFALCKRGRSLSLCQSFSVTLIKIEFKTNCSNKRASAKKNMASDNTHKSQEEKPDVVENLNTHLIGAGETIANNRKYIYWGVGIIALVACFTLSYLFIYRNPRLKESAEAYTKVEMAAMGNDSIASKEYAKVADKYTSTDGGNLAALSAAEAYYNLGDYNKALEYLKKFSSKDKVLGSNAEVLMGDCYVNLKKYNEAIDCFTNAIRKADGNPQIVPRVLLKQAVVYDALKKYDKALECYETIKKDYPQFELGNGVDVNAYIEREKARLGK